MSNSLIITERGNLNDPAVIVIDLKWMRKLRNYDQSLFNFFVASIFSNDPWKEPWAQKAHGYGINEVDNRFNAGHTAGVDINLEWIRAMEKMITSQWSSKHWNWIKKNVPPKVMTGWDMQIGGEEAPYVFGYIMDQEKDVEELIIITSYNTTIEVLVGADTDYTIRFIGEADGATPSEGVMIEDPKSVVGNLGIGRSGDSPGVNTGDGNFSAVTLIPKGIYRLANLSDESMFRAAINYIQIRS